MGRRRRAGRSTAAEEEEDSESEPSTPQPPAKRKRADTKIDTSELFQQLYDHIRNYKRKDGTIVCEAFIRAPKKRQDPVYFETVSNPIDLLRIQQKLRTDEYMDITQMSADIELLLKNAKSYYKPDSQEYQDACDLSEQFNIEKCRLFNLPYEPEEKKDKIILRINKSTRKSGSEKQMSPAPLEEEAESPAPFDFEMADEYFTAVMQAVDTDGELFNPPFLLLPSKKQYPDYYEVIQTPTDLKMIAKKIQKNMYHTLNDLEADLLQMVKNACTYNEPGSLIYKRAKAFRKVITDKKKELERGGNLKVDAGKGDQGRLRIRRKQPGPSFLAQVMEMEYEEVEEIAGEDKVYGDPDDPMWQLFTVLRNYTVVDGVRPSESFMKLPNKRWFADYYTLVENPISFSLIRKKLLAGIYGTVAELAGEFNVIFESAKAYHEMDTKWYKDAVLLQKHMQSKLHEIYERKDESEGEQPEKKKRGRPPKAGTPSRATLPVDEVDLKTRLRTLFRTVMDYLEEDGRQPVVAFLEKPSKKLYPEYYQVILEPMDMLTIEGKIKDGKYASEEDLIDDFKLMFNNCRQFNEEGSVIYDDADFLERVLMDKSRSIGVVSKRGGYRKRVIGNGIQARIRSLYDAVREYVDEQDRHLATIFMKLPSKAEYPDYYELIQNPIDLDQIGTKVRNNQYATLEDLLKDTMLMFDNACKYNEPDSQIYKDVLSLQLIAVQTKIELSSLSEDEVPDVSGIVQSLMMEMFVSVYNREDDSGRFYSDSMCELPEHDELDGKKVRGLSLDLIKRRVDGGLYKRLDIFQEDLFAFFDRARRLSRTDSQTFEDTIELQSFYIRQRNLLCKNGAVLSSPALSYTYDDLMREVEGMKHSKKIFEQQEDDFDALKAEDESTRSDIDSFSIDKEIYKPGDFVYYDHKEKGLEPRIFQIVRLSTNKDGQKMFHGNFFARPIETYHLSARLFLVREVFKTEVHQSHPLSDVVGRCYVMPVKDYFKLKPEGFDDKDIYVCESRYNSKQRHFRKIKILCWDLPTDVEIIPREVPLEQTKVRSVFKERVLKHKEEIMELEELASMPEKRYPNLELQVQDAPLMATYFQQFQSPAGLLRTGDCVYVRGENGRQLIAQVDSMWLGADGTAYFHGPWYVTPSEMPYPPKLCYKQEVFLSSIEDSNPILSITGRCVVLDYHEYTTLRPTEFAEVDIYLCEAMYEESRREIRGLPSGGLKRHRHDLAVKRDEMFYFNKNLIPRKEPPPVKIQPPSTPVHTGILLEASESMCEDSMDGPPASVGSAGDTISSLLTPVRKTPKAKDGSVKTKVVTGYIVYASEYRKSFAQKFPERSFGDISRLVGAEWKKLSQADKQIFENKAVKANEENAAEAAVLRAQLGIAAAASDTPKAPPSTPPIREDALFECLWAGCEIVFEDIVDLQDHVCTDPSAHLNQLNKVDDTNLHCQWKGCSRVKKGLPPFPNWARLLRHVREVHCQKNTGRAANLVDKSKPLVKKRIVEHPPPPPSHQTPPPQQLTVIQNPGNSGEEYHAPIERKIVTPAPASPARNLPDPNPIFIAVPPRPHRINHSDIYKKYIENMQSGSRFMSDWDKPAKTIEKEKIQVTPELQKLASTWLLPEAQSGDIVEALLQMRERLIRESATIARLF